METINQSSKKDFNRYKKHQVGSLIDLLSKKYF